MNFLCLQKILSNKPPFRLKQARQAIFRDLAEDWNKASALPLALREKLNRECPLKIKGELIGSKEEKNALKAVLTMADGLKIETVLMRHQTKASPRNTVCVSSQAGCALGCSFCATGAGGLKRSLTAEEIVEQVLFFARFLKKQNERVTNVVFMGMGEPFQNYDSVLAAIKILNEKEGLNIGARKISVSTCGIVEGIKKLATEKFQVNLAVSLHASDDTLRSGLMPINKKYPIAEVLKAVDEYIKKTSRRVMLEYLLLEEINDSPEQAQELARLAKRPLVFVNLIVYNPVGGKDLKGSSKDRVKEFKMILEKAGVEVTQRYRFGRKTKAACGQLALEK